MPAIPPEVEARLIVVTERLKAGELTDGHEIYAAISDLGFYKYVPAWDAVEPYLRHEDGQIRGRAIFTLALEMNLVGYRDTCEQMMVEDPDDDARRSAATALGHLLSGTHDLDAMKKLARVLRDPSEDVITRSSAYDSILKILGAPYTKQQLGAYPSHIAMLIERANWDLVEGIEREFDRREGGEV